MQPASERGPAVRRGWSLRTRFVLAALACLLPLLGVCVYILFQSLENNQEQLEDTERQTADIVSNSLANTLQESEILLNTLVNDAGVRGLSQTDATEAMNGVLPYRPSVAGFFLLDPNNRFIAQAGTDPTSILPTLEEGMLDRVRTGETGVSNTLRIGESDFIAVAVQVPADEKGENNGSVLGALLKVERIAGMVTPYAGQDAIIAVVSEHKMIASSASPQLDDGFTVRLSKPIGLALAGAEGTYTYDDEDGHERLAVYTPVDFSGAQWAVIVSNPAPNTYGSNRTLFQQSLGALAIAGLLALILALILGEITARPIRRLTAQAAAMAEGDFTQRIEPAGGGELLSLSTTFRDMEDRLAQQVKEMESAREAREQQAEELRDLHRRTVRLQEDERRRIAGEIHDAVSPLITGALYQARALRMANGSTPPEERDAGLDAVADLLGRAGDELHGVIFALRPPDLDDLGLVPAIERHIQTIQRPGLSVRFELLGEPPTLTPEIRLGIYRIVQEALHNTFRHADADEAVVRLESSPDLLRVVVRDNGSGFDVNRAQGPTSLGILSMRERATAIGATFELASRAGGGTVIVIERRDPDAITPEPGANGDPGTLEAASAPADSARENLEVMAATPINLTPIRSARR